jgi:hypothetical protein
MIAMAGFVPAISFSGARLSQPRRDAGDKLGDD